MASNAELCNEHGKRHHVGCKPCVAARAQRDTRKCLHFNGTVHDECEAGVNYHSLLGSGFGCFKDMPCLGEGSVVCQKRTFPTYESALAKVEAGDLEVAQWVAKLNRHECDSCGKTYKGKQVGRCVYCEHCGNRLFQGTVPDAD